MKGGAADRPRGTRHLPGDDGFSRLDNPELYAAMDAAKRAGKVRFMHPGFHGDSTERELRKEIEALLDEKAPAP